MGIGVRVCVAEGLGVAVVPRDDVAGTGVVDERGSESPGAVEVRSGRPGAALQAAVRPRQRTTRKMVNSLCFITVISLLLAGSQMMD